MQDMIYKFIAKMLRIWFKKAETRSKKIKTISRIMDDPILHEIVIDAAEYLSKKSTNTYDDKIVKELKRQSLIDINTRSIKRA